MEELKQVSKADEIDLIEVAKKIWIERKIIYIVAVVSLVLGLLIAFGTPREYKAETILLIETSSGSSMNGLLQQFGGLAGINLGGTKDGDQLSPDIYPEIINSTPFLVELLREKVHCEKEDSSITVYQFLVTKIRPSVIGVALSYTVGLPIKLIGAFSKKEVADFTLPNLEDIPLRLSNQQIGIIESLKSRIKISSKSEKNTLSITVEVPDPIVAAELTNAVYKYLSKYLIDYKIQKVKTDLEFVSKQLQEANLRYLETQQRLANYRDINRNVTLASYKTEEDRLQNDYSLAFNIYNGLSQQFEQAKLKVQEKTPVFKIMEPVRVPMSKSKPQRGFIIVSFLFIGIIMGIGAVFGKIFFVNLSKLR